MRHVTLAFRCIATAAVLAGVWPAAAAPKAGAHRPYSDVEYWSGLLDAPSRNEWQRPVEVLTMLGLQPGDAAADLGAGTGYFTVFLALVVGPTGKVYAVDTEPAMLERIKQRKEIENKDTVVTVLAAPDDPKLPDKALQLVLVVDTWHHLRNRVAYLSHLERALAPGGRVAVIDFRKEELPVGPPPQDKIAREAVVEEFAKAGWSLAAESLALPYQYFLVFHPPKRG